MHALKLPTRRSTRRELNRFLERHEAPSELWGRYEATWSVADLHAYLRDDQVSFRNGDTAGLVIDVNVAVVIVRYTHPNGRVEELVERYHFVPSTGAILSREYRGMAETMKHGESPRNGALRGLREELGFVDRREFEITQTYELDVRPPKDSEKWPTIGQRRGIQASYHRHVFSGQISDKLYRPEGYFHKEKDRIIIFTWRPVVPP